MESGAVMVVAAIVAFVPWAWLAVRDVRRQHRRLVRHSPSYAREVLAESGSDELAELRERVNELVMEVADLRLEREPKVRLEGLRGPPERSLSIAGLTRSRT